MTSQDFSLRSDVAFTPSVKEAQRKRGSREGYAKVMARRDWSNALPAELQEFVSLRDSFYFATASQEGQPYIQHRGGEPGFLAVLDASTLAFADYAGNRQYISVGNLDENDRVMLFLMDYPNRTRLKVWGTAEVVEPPDPSRFAAVLEASPGQTIERIIVVRITAWDLNCPKHITPRFSERELRAMTE